MKSCHFSILLHGGYSSFVKCFVCWSQECVCQLIYKQACLYYVSHAKKSFSPGWKLSLQWLIISTALMFSTLNNRSHMYLFKNVCVWGYICPDGNFDSLTWCYFSTGWTVTLYQYLKKKKKKMYPELVADPLPRLLDSFDRSEWEKHVNMI